MSNVFTTSVSGMNDAVTRLMSSANNIANASTTGKLPASEDENATSYQPTDVVSVSQSVGDHHFGVTTEVVQREPSYTVARNPESPDANAEGLVAVPNVDIAGEAINMMMAEAAYKSNAKVIEVARDMENALLDTLA